MIRRTKEHDVPADERDLDALAAGEGRADHPDPALRMLAAWRSDLDADLPELDVPLPRPPVPPRHRGGTGGRPRSRRPRRARRMVLATGVAALATSGLVGVAMASADARPGSPLFSVTKVIYPDQATYRERVAEVQRDLADARRAAAEGRRQDARRLLARARRHSRHIPAPDAERARQQADQVRRHLDNSARSESNNGAHGHSSQPSPSTGPQSPQSTSPTPAPSASQTPTTESSDQGDDEGGNNGQPGNGHGKGKGNGHGKPD